MSVLQGRRRRYARSAVSALAVAWSLGALAGCGGVSQRPGRAPAVAASTAPAIAAFERDPNAANWEALHASLLKGAIAPEIESRLIEALANRQVPRNVFAAAAVDLATLDWGGAIQWVQKVNVAARGGRNPTAVANSSALAWMLLALRPTYANDPVDLTHADLRSGSPPDGLPLNLARVDFSRSELSAMTWSNSVLTDALFLGTSVDGVLKCTNCTFGTLQYGGTVVLSDGKWRPR
ncbi:MAG TPA: hypothetical protein VGF86_09535 [Candidatus Tumulicola sp.]